MSEYRHIANLAGPAGIGSHGVISTPTNLNDLRGPEHTGSYVIRASNIIGGPQSSQEGDVLVTLDIMWNANNAVTQFLTTVNEVWWRASPTGTAWGWWRKLSRENGIIDEPTDLDELRGRPGDGYYAIRTENMINGPNITSTTPMLLEVQFAANNATTQRLVGAGQAWERKSTSSTTWARWFRVDGPGSGTLIDEETDLNQLYLEKDIGTYAIRAENMINGPDVEGNPLGVLTVGWAGARNAVSQTYQTEDRHFWRNLRFFDTVTWGPWNRTLSTGDAGDITGIVSSPVVRRIITSTDPDEPLQDGDLLLVIEED